MPQSTIGSWPCARTSTHNSARSVSSNTAAASSRHIAHLPGLVARDLTAQAFAPRPSLTSTPGARDRKPAKRELANLSRSKNTPYAERATLVEVCELAFERCRTHCDHLTRQDRRTQRTPRYAPTRRYDGRPACGRGSLVPRRESTLAAGSHRAGQAEAAHSAHLSK